MTDEAVRPPLLGDHTDLAAALAAAAEQFPSRAAYIDRSGARDVLTFRDWSSAATRFAAELHRRGLRPGDLLAIHLPSSIGFAIAYAGGLRAGLVVSGINSRLGPTEVAAILESSGVRAVVGDTTGVPEDVVLVETAAVDAARAGRVPDFDPPAWADGRPAVVIWTSGTTGTPKGAWYGQEQLKAAVWSAGVMSAPNDCRLVATPFAHAGYMAKVWDQIAWGITFVIPPSPWKAPTTLAVLQEEEVTVVGAVPTQWAKLLEHGLAGTPLPSLRLATSATAPAPPQLVDAVRTALGVPLIVRYAMTEAPSITGTEPDDRTETQSRTVGHPQSGMEVRVLSPEGAPVPAGDVGEIAVRGSCVMSGYWRAPETTAAVLDSDGWLRTGDLGRLNPDGDLELTGRRGDMYIRGGYNVYPLEVESVLMEHPSVSQVAVVGVSTPVIGERGLAFVVPQRDTAPTLQELRELVRSRLADYKAPDEVVILKQLPTTAMMKIDRHRLRQLAAQGS